MKEKLLKRLNEILSELSQDNANVELLEAEHREIEKQLAQIELREKVERSVKAGERGNVKEDSIEERAASEVSDAEKRGRDLLEKRAVKLSAGALGVIASSEIKQTFEDASGIANVVTATEAIGAESYEQPFVKSYGTGDYTAEGAEAEEAEPVFGYAKLRKSKITAYAEISKEMQKLPPASYDKVVRNAVAKALDKKIVREIFNGDGGEGHLTGIFHNPGSNKVIETETDIEVSAIGNDTLDEIIYSYGGSESVEGGGACVLFLNKKDLKAFAKLRGTDKRKLHDIKLNGNKGYIDSVPFMLTDACNAVSDSETTQGKYCMAYGYVENYEKAIFSDVEVEESKDFKFRQGMVAYRAEVYVGGNVVAYNGFIRVKKGA